MLFAHVKCDSSVWQGSTLCPARGFLMISGLVTHFSTYPSAVGEPTQSPIPLPAQDTGHLLRDGLCRALPMGLRPQTAYFVTLDKGCLPLSLPMCLTG